MRYPFPGMDPWLENSQLWRGVHNRLIIGLGDVLAVQLTPRYFVDVETHTYVARFPDEPIGSRYPDVSILDMGGAAVKTKAAGAATLPVEIDLPRAELLEEPYLEIRLVPEGEVVTVIELLSHTNKLAGKERDTYLEKREAFLEADVNFVEIDFLRAYSPMPYTERDSKGLYRIFIRRKVRPYKGYLYPFGVRQSIPLIPIPLQPGEEEPIIDLGAILRSIYERVRYDLVIDYSKPPVPALEKADAAWAQELVAQARSTT